MFKKYLCELGFHDYSIRHQYSFMIHTGMYEVVIAWNNCSRCYKTKLIHILR